jgi:gliding motility-associated-like protein
LQKVFPILVLFLLLFYGNVLYGQCIIQSGPPPSNISFNTASDGNGKTIGPGLADKKWQFSMDSINGSYQPAIVMTNLPPDYYKSPWIDCNWISINAQGSHSYDRNIFYKMDFDLPCFNGCGRSYDSSNTFCLNLDVFADNSIFEIYVNGVPQSNHLGNLIPNQDPFHYAGAIKTAMVSFSLCQNWKSGTNNIIIQVASSAPSTGFLAQASTIFQDKNNQYVDSIICEGTQYLFGTQILKTTGIFTNTYHLSAGCDSIVTLNLKVLPKKTVAIQKTICEGSLFLGYSKAGLYTDTLHSILGCDSIRTLDLQVLKKPVPDLGIVTSICMGDSILLNPGKFSSYLWQDGNTMQSYVVRTPGKYTVTVTNACGTSLDSIFITPKNCNIYFPNAFSPNKDGLNDTFKVLTDYVFEMYRLTIYNRWGEIVFETTEPRVGWNGSYKGIMQDSQNFVWVCNYTRAGNSTQMNGIVLLLK